MSRAHYWIWRYKYRLKRNWRRWHHRNRVCTECAGPLTNIYVEIGKKCGECYERHDLAMGTVPDKADIDYGACRLAETAEARTRGWEA